MPTCRHVMIDLETMGLTPDSAIVSIGAVLFDPRYNIAEAGTFYRELDWESQGRKIDRETLTWWEGQSSEARAALGGLDDLGEVLTDLAARLPKDARVWANGPSFDIAMLEHAYRQHHIEVPWKHYNVRDCRTVLDMFENSRGGLNRSLATKVTHNALNDAKLQSSHITEMWRKILQTEQ